MIKSQYEFKTKYRSLYLVASPEELLGVFLTKQKVPTVVKLEDSKQEHKIISDTVRQLQEYFLGTRKQFDIKF